MNKFLRYSLSLVLAFVASVTFAQEVTFDFAGNNWKLPASKEHGITNATDFTNGTYTITVSAPEKHTILHQTMPSSMEKRTHISTFLSLTLM